MPPDLPRIAFYPCCSGDVVLPCQLLDGRADEIIFCDINPSIERRLPPGPSIRPTFWAKDARVALQEIDHIDFFFYRRDGTCEGGSGLFFLGATLFPILLSKMTGQDCRIITDGSNSRGKRFQKMQRKSGLVEAGKHIALAEKQPYRQFGLLEFTVLIA